MKANTRIVPSEYYDGEIRGLDIEGNRITINCYKPLNGLSCGLKARVQIARRKDGGEAMDKETRKVLEQELQMLRDDVNKADMKLETCQRRVGDFKRAHPDIDND